MKINWLITNPLFWIGLLLKIVLVWHFDPSLPTKYFVPFLQQSLENLQHDPWGTWREINGAVEAFPYGYAMWISFIPLTSFSLLILDSAEVGYYGSLLVFDAALLLLLKSFFPFKDNFLLVTYWLSPIILAATYALGLNDLIPVFFFVLSIGTLKRLNFRSSGFYLVIAISAKLSIILAVPFFIVYLFQSKALRPFLLRFFEGMMLSFVALIIPYLFSHSAIEMLITNRQLAEVFQFKLSLDEQISVYIVPLIYVILLYHFWNIRRISFEIFQSMTGLSFMTVLLLAPFAPGWFVWILPMLSFYAQSQKLSNIFHIKIFGVFFAFRAILPELDFPEFGKSLPRTLASVDGNIEFISIAQTMLIAGGFILAFKIWREDVSLNNFFRMSRKPTLIGIAGDSGSGKDTLVDSLEDIFGRHSLAKISGDDYHFWERRRPVWKALTHLNPVANDLEAFTRDIFSLKDGKPIEIRRYDHSLGVKHAQTITKSNDYIIASGLHTLYSPLARSCFDVKIFLDMDENLRKYLKIRRDVGQRGHSLKNVLLSFEKRENDAVKYIRPQKAFADLVFSLSVPREQQLADVTEFKELAYRLTVSSRGDLNTHSLVRVLVAMCGLQVEWKNSQDAKEVEIEIEGDVSSEDISLAFKMLLPNLSEFLDVRPKWSGGMLGLMQLITLVHLNESQTRRLL